MRVAWSEWWPTFGSHIHKLTTKQQDLCLSPQPCRQTPSASFNSVARSSSFYLQVLIFCSTNQNGNQAETLALLFHDTARSARSPLFHHLTAPRKVTATPFGCPPQLRDLRPCRRWNASQALRPPEYRRRTFDTCAKWKRMKDGKIMFILEKKKLPQQSFCLQSNNRGWKLSAKNVGATVHARVGHIFDSKILPWTWRNFKRGFFCYLHHKRMNIWWICTNHVF